MWYSFPLSERPSTAHSGRGGRGGETQRRLSGERREVLVRCTPSCTLRHPAQEEVGETQPPYPCLLSLLLLPSPSRSHVIPDQVCSTYPPSGPPLCSPAHVLVCVHVLLLLLLSLGVVVLLGGASGTSIHSHPTPHRHSQRLLHLRGVGDPCLLTPPPPLPPPRLRRADSIDHCLRALLPNLTHPPIVISP